MLRVKREGTLNVKKRGIIISILSVIIVCLVGASGYAYYNSKSYDNLIFPGVKINGIDVGGKTQEEAKKVVNDKFINGINNININIDAKENKYSMSYSALDVKYDVNAAIKDAYNFEKNSNIFSKYIAIKKAKIHDIRMNFIYNDKPIKELVTKIKKEVDKAPINAKLSVNDESNIKILPEQKGIKVDEVKLEKIINTNIKNETGTDINIKAPIIETEAKVTASKLKPINAQIASFQTDYSTSSDSRANNIQLATRTINGTVVMPGETFSFNGILGERTEEKGYQAAPVIIDNKLDSGLGGGICQVSTTLYNAILRANIDATERSHHSLPSHYVSLGMDATVDYGNLDYKFKNTLKYPIYIEGVTYDGNVCFNIYSNSSLKKIKVEITNDVYQVMQPDMSYVNDPNLIEGKTEVDKEGSTGYKVKVYKKVYSDGKVISQELIANDYYKPQSGITRVGTKKEVKPNNVQEQPQVKPQTKTETNPQNNKTQVKPQTKPKDQNTNN